MGKKDRENAQLRGKGRQQDVARERDELAARRADEAAGDDASGSNDDDATGIDAWVDDTLDSSAQTRSAAFTKLNEFLASDHNAEELEHALSSLRVAIVRTLKKADNAELVLVLHTLQLCIVTLGADAESLYAEFNSVLKSMLVTVQHADARAAVWQTLALLTFIAAPEDDDPLTLLDLIAPEISRTDVVAGAALRCWGFLASIVSADIIVKRLFESQLPRFVAQLEAIPADIHVAAANNIGLMFDMWKSAMALDGSSIGIEECAVVDVDSVRERVKELAQSVAKQSKASERNKRDWRIMLRRVERALSVDEDDDGGDNDEDEVYYELEFKTQKVQVEGFSMLIQAEFFRTVLATGFAAHMTKNPLLQEVFDLHARDSSETNALVKRRNNAKANKERQQGRYKGRDRKGEKNSVALTNSIDDGDNE